MKIKLKNGIEYEITRYTREYISRDSEKKLLSIMLETDSTETFDSICENMTEDNISHIVVVEDNEKNVTSEFDDYILESVVENNEDNNHSITIRVYKSPNKE